MKGSLISAFLVLSLGCTQAKQKSGVDVNEITSQANSQRLCTVNGYLPEPACQYSAEELIGLDKAVDLPVQTEGIIRPVAGKAYLTSASLERGAILINPIADKDILLRMVSSPDRRKAIIFGRYTSHKPTSTSQDDVEGVLDAYSIKWSAD